MVHAKETMQAEPRMQHGNTYVSNASTKEKQSPRSKNNANWSRVLPSLEENLFCGIVPPRKTMQANPTVPRTLCRPHCRPDLQKVVRDRQ